MFKRILKTCVATALLVSSAHAANSTGTYSAQTPGGKLVIELRPLQDDLLRGTVHYGGEDFPLVGKEVAANVNGTWEFRGQHIPFTSSLHDNTLTLTTNGATYTLEKTTPVEDDNAQGIIHRPAVPAAASRNALLETATPREGRAFRYAVPQGWDAKESAGGVDMGAPDGITGMSHSFFISPGKSEPKEVFDILLAMAPQMRWNDVKVESSTPCNEGGALGAYYNLSYQIDGKAAHALIVIIVYNEPNRNVARIVVLQAPAANFAGDKESLMALAHKVEVTHPDLVDHNGDRHLDQPVQEEQQPDRKIESVKSQYENSQTRMDEINRRYDDLMRGR